MSRAGRKRKAGLRTPSGQLSRSRAAMQEDVPQVQVRMRNFGLSEEDARDGRASSVVGRMLLTKRLSHVQHLAALKWLDVYQAFKRAVVSPDRARAAGGEVRPSGDDSEDYEAWCANAMLAHKRAMAAVMVAQCDVANRGRQMIAALDYLVVRDQGFVHMESDLKVALDVLIAHFGLTTSRDSDASAGNRMVASV